MKTVYFVRHGESEGNAGHYFQGTDTPLTTKGEEQARVVALRARSIPVDLMISSSLYRVQQTAQIIADSIQKPFETSDLFNERLRPSTLIGKKLNDPEARIMENRWIQSFIGGARVGDGENFDDVKIRASRALDYLASRQEENILVVTSGFLLRMFVAQVIFGSELSEVEFNKMEGAFKTENTGITVFKYDPKKKRQWCVWVWNDHAHLG